MAPKRRKDSSKAASSSDSSARKRKSAPDPSADSAILKAKCSALEKEKLKLIESLQAHNKTSNANSRRESTQNDAMKNSIASVLERHVWRKVKFITTYGQEQDAVKYVWKMLDQPQAVAENKAELELFLANYTAFVTTKLNALRTYQTQRMSDVALKLVTVGLNADEEGDDEDSASPLSISALPTIKQMEACIMRNFKATDKQMMDIFMWYWDHFLPRAAGSGKYFKPAQRHYATITSCAPENDRTRPYITPQTEAFAVLAFENNYERVQLQAYLKAKYPHCKIVPTKYMVDDNGKSTGTEAPEGTDHKVVGNKCYTFGPKSRGKYTLSDVGQDRFGGWSTEGLNRYNSLVKMAKKGRHSTHCVEIEAKSLEQLREKLGLKAKTHQEEQSTKSAGRPERASVATWHSLDSDEESESESDENTTVSGENGGEVGGTNEE